MDRKKQVFSDKVPPAVGPYSQAIKVPGLIFTSGQLPIDPKTNTMPESIEEQTHMAFKNLQAVIEAGGASLADIVKTTVFLADLSEFKQMNEVYLSYFSQPFPARSAFQVAKLPLGAKIEIEAVVSTLR